MAVKLGHNLDLEKKELQNARIQNLSSAPSSPVAGQVYFNTTDGMLYFYDGTDWVEAAGSGSAITALTGDVSASGPGSAAATVNTVGGASAANIADAVTKRHTQNTDTGTTATSFQLDSGNTGPRLKNSSGTIAARNSADNADANLSAADISASGNVVITGNLTVNGTTTTLNTTTMETGDNIIVLNSEITGSSGNANAGIEVKRFHTDDLTARNVQMIYNETSDRWTADINPDTSSAPTTRDVALKYATNIGDNSATSIDVAHNLNSRDVTVQVREVGSPYAFVFCDIEAKDVNTVTIKFAAAPTTNQYRVIVVG